MDDIVWDNLTGTRGFGDIIYSIKYGGLTDDQLRAIADLANAKGLVNEGHMEATDFDTLYHSKVIANAR